MWKDAWDSMVLVCGNHADNSNIMELINENGNICYRCPCCTPGYAEESCTNRISVLEYERILDRLDEKSGDIFTIASLKGYRWKSGKHKFFVLDDDEGNYRIKATKIK